MLLIVRVGGSLLTWNELPTALAAWCDRRPEDTCVLIAGGGPWVEGLREAAVRFGLDDPTSHELSVRAMSVTAGLLQAVTSKLGAPLLDDLAELRRAIAEGRRRVVVFDVRPFLEQAEPRAPGDRLPHSWDVTSDSIAARLAAVVEADELVLLKSADPPAEGGESLSLWAARGYVDRHFPQAARNMIVRCENLRTFQIHE